MGRGEGLEEACAPGGRGGDGPNVEQGGVSPVDRRAVGDGGGWGQSWRQGEQGKDTRRRAVWLRGVGVRGVGERVLVTDTTPSLPGLPCRVLPCRVHREGGPLLKGVPQDPMRMRMPIRRMIGPLFPLAFGSPPSRVALPGQGT